MTRKEYRALSDKYNMELLTEPITGENWGFYLDSDHYIDELDELADKIDCRPVVCQRLKLGGIIRYRLIAPSNWFTLGGLKD